MARTVTQVPLVLGVDEFEMIGQALADCFREERDPVFLPFAGSNDDLASIEIDILDAQVRAFEKSQACTVEKCGHELRRTFELGEE